MKFSLGLYYVLAFLAGQGLGLPTESATSITTKANISKRNLQLAGDNGQICWARSTNSLTNPAYGIALTGLWNALRANLGVPGNVGNGWQYIYDGPVQSGVRWRAEITVFAETSLWQITDALQYVYEACGGGGVTARAGGTAAVAAVGSSSLGALVEMVAMKNGGANHIELRSTAENLNITTASTGQLETLEKRSLYFDNCDKQTITV
ncbi:hypothetical protein GGI35DRAFT_476085 [Trichoderma velutinum]